jgi:hypothetical protein
VLLKQILTKVLCWAKGLSRADELWLSLLFLWDIVLISSHFEVYLSLQNYKKESEISYVYPIF